jgi:hypothetical protein
MNLAHEALKLEMTGTASGVQVPRVREKGVVLLPEALANTSHGGRHRFQQSEEASRFLVALFQGRTGNESPDRDAGAGIRVASVFYALVEDGFRSPAARGEQNLCSVTW